MSEHPQVQEQLALYPSLDQHARQPLEQHLSTCPDCTETLAAYTAMDQALHRLVDHKLHYLATQPVQPPLMLGQGYPAQAAVHVAPQRSWLKGWRHALPQPRTFVLQLAGAGVLILLLVALSLLFAAWNPQQEHQIASTPTFEHPLATATPQLYGDWGLSIAAHAQTATPTVPLQAAPVEQPSFAQQPAMLLALHGLAMIESPFMVVDKAKITPFTVKQLAIAQRKVARLFATQRLFAT